MQFSLFIFRVSLVFLVLADIAGLAVLGYSRVKTVSMFLIVVAWWYGTWGEGRPNVPLLHNDGWKEAPEWSEMNLKGVDVHPSEKSQKRIQPIYLANMQASSFLEFVKEGLKRILVP